MTGDQPKTEPGIASVEQGQVILDGPDGIALAMTPAAAAETGRRLIAAAAVASSEPGTDPSAEGAAV